MRKVIAETPSRIQQSVIGTDAIKPVGRGLATVRGAVRITPAGAALKGALPLNLTVAFIGLSGLAPMRAGSLRGATGTVTEAGGGGKEVGGFRAESNGASGAFASEFDGRGKGGRAMGGAGGRLGDEPAAGGMGFGATNGGGGRTRGGAGEVELGAGGRVIPGGRAGKLVGVGSCSTGTAGRCVLRGGNVIRTVSFSGSFNSAILL
jgi:hypothetical protein